MRIVDDDFCDPEQFFSNIELLEGDPVIIVNPNVAEVAIQDSDCGKLNRAYYGIITMYDSVKVAYSHGYNYSNIMIEYEIRMSFMLQVTLYWLYRGYGE